MLRPQPKCRAIARRECSLGEHRLPRSVSEPVTHKQGHVDEAGDRVCAVPVLRRRRCAGLSLAAHSRAEHDAFAVLGLRMNCAPHAPTSQPLSAQCDVAPVEIADGSCIRTVRNALTCMFTGLRIVDLVQCAEFAPYSPASAHPLEQASSSQASPQRPLYCRSGGPGAHDVRSPGVRRRWPHRSWSSFRRGGIDVDHERAESETV